MSKISVEKRNRIFEIITGIIIIYLSLDAFMTNLKVFFPSREYVSWATIKEIFALDYSWLLVLNFIAILLNTVIGAMLITRKYSKLWLQIPLCITAASALITSRGSLTALGYFIDDFAYMHKYFDSVIILCSLSSTLLNLIYFVVAFLTINKKIVWRSRKSLLIYTFIAVGVSLFLKVSTPYASVSIFTILLPSFMQNYTEKSSKKGILGEAAILLFPLSPYFFKFLLKKIADPAKENMYNFFFGTNPAIDLSGDNYQRYTLFISILLMLLMPLMLFERKMELDTEKESSGTGIVKKLDSILFKDDDGYDNDEYEDEEYSDDEYSDDEDEEDDNADD
jgi:hypothetical protein